MAISPTVLTSGADTTDATSFTTASITPVATDPILLCVGSGVTGLPCPVPTITGNGLTWAQVTTRLHSNNNRRITAFRAASATPSAGTILIDFGVGNTQGHCQWAVIQFAGVDDSGTDGSAMIVQFNSVEATNVTSLSVPLNAFADPSNNAAFGIFFHQATEGTNPGAGFTELTDTNVANPQGGFQTEWRLGQP